MGLRIEETIRQFMLDNLLAYDENQSLEDDDNIFESGFVDSSFAMQLVLFVEDAFNVSITDDDLDLANFSSINRITQFVKRKKMVEF
jgi:acyl carrier protein